MRHVSMHLLVLSAFRLSFNADYHVALYVWSQCTFWCSVLSDGGSWSSHKARPRVSMHLLVLSAFRPATAGSTGSTASVSMHLLVLSAFRLNSEEKRQLAETAGLNAPFGAQCFPTCSTSIPLRSSSSRLNAPFGAQCFPTTRRRRRRTRTRCVSMHLLVLSAFRR